MFIIYNVYTLLNVSGQRLNKADDHHVAGQGTYVRNGYIYSSLAGFVETVKKDVEKVSVISPNMS